MAIRDHPRKGSILLCDFTQGFCAPEMVKVRPVVVLTPKLPGRPGLCTVVALSTTPPKTVMPYHAKLDIHPPLPDGFQSREIWIKGDMIYSIAFHRLNFIRTGKDASGKRLYYFDTLNKDQLRMLHTCVLRGLGLPTLTKHL